MLNIAEYNNEALKTHDIESRAIIVYDCKNNYKNLISFGEFCISQYSDENGEFYITRYGGAESKAVSISQDEFLKNFEIIRSYIISSILREKNDKIIEAICFWDDWNNIFQVFEVNDFYYGINWWTTV